MKKIFFVFILVTIVIVDSVGLRKFKKHGTNIDGFEAYNDSMNQTEQKMIGRIVQNFKENEQMSEIISIFKKIKTNVQIFDEKLSNYSKKVLALNKEIKDFVSLNQFETNGKPLLSLHINQNISVLERIKANFSEILIEVQGFSGFLNFRNLFTGITGDNSSNYTLGGGGVNISNFQNMSSFKEINNDSSLNLTNKTSPVSEKAENSSYAQFDMLFSLMKTLHRSRKLLKNLKNAHNLSEIQKKSEGHLEILKNNSGKANSSGLNESSRLRENETNKSIEKTLEDVSSIKNNFKSMLETVEYESNMLYNLNQKNKLKRMNMENYLTEEIEFLKNMILSFKKIKRWSLKLENYQNEVIFFISYFYRIMKI